MTLLLTTALFTLALGVLLAWVYFRLLHTSVGADFDAEWWAGFSPARYAPMARLLRNEDIQFLRSASRRRPGLEKRLRRARVEVFRGYLDEMRGDFSRLHSLGMAMILAGQVEANFKDQLFQQKLQFAQSYWRVRLELVGWRLGLATVDVTALVESLSSAALLFQPAPAAA